MSSRPALGPTQSLIQWVLGLFIPGVRRPQREAGHSPPTSAEVKKTWIYTSIQGQLLIEICQQRWHLNISNQLLKDCVSLYKILSHNDVIGQPWIEYTWCNWTAVWNEARCWLVDPRCTTYRLRLPPHWGSCLCAAESSHIGSWALAQAPQRSATGPRVDSERQNMQFSSYQINLEYCPLLYLGKKNKVRLC
jgi:hypothetical protein